MRPFLNALVSTTALAAALSVTNLAYAQESQAPDDSDVVVVTASRREQALQDVPVTVAAISGDALESAGVFNTADLAGQVPNLVVASPYGDAQPNFILRGISVGNEFNSNQASPIGFYVDENYISARFAQGMQLFDLERVEVVKGPQGTLYGRNTTGGAINVITRRPELDGSNGYVTAGYGNFDTKELSGAAEFTLIPDVLGIRGAVTWSEGDGQLENLTPGKPDMRSTDNSAGRLAIRYRPNDALDFDLRLYSAESHPLADVPLTLGVGPGGAQADGYVRPASYGFWQTDSADTGEFVTIGSGAAFNARWSLGDFQIISLTAYDRGKQGLHNDFDGSAPDWGVVDWRAKFEQFNQDVRLQYDGDGFVGTVGAYYGWDENRTHNTYDFFSLLQGIFPGFNPPANPAADLTTGLFPGPVTGFAVDHYFTQTRRSSAVYAEGEWQLTDQLTAIAGLRYTHDEIELDDVQSFALDYNFTPQLNLIPPGLYDPTAQFGPIEDSGNTVTGRFILKYQLTDDVNVYGSYSRGYRSGAINGTAYLSPAQLTFVEPEEVNAYEFGVKSELFDNRLRLNAATFFYDYSNQQLQEVILVVPFLRNAPAAEVFGIDVDATLEVTDDLTINWGLGVIDTEYKELSLSGFDLSGNKFTNAPEMTSNVSADWRIGEAMGGDVRLFTNATYIGDTYFSPFNEVNNNGNLQQAAYWTLDGRLSWSNGAYEVALWAKNILEEEYYTYGLNLQNGFGLDYLVAGAPRTYGIQVRAEF